MLIGGPPCQGFSIAGFRNEKDPRNKLIYSYFSLIEDLDPDIVLLENVRNFKNIGNGFFLKYFISNLIKYDYTTEYFFLKFLSN